jgi:hypothetical protein
MSKRPPKRIGPLIAEGRDLTLNERIILEKRLDELTDLIYEAKKEWGKLHQKLNPPKVIAITSEGEARRMVDPGVRQPGSRQRRS